MTDIETQATLLLNSSPARKGVPLTYDITRAHAIEALCRAIEQHEAFRQEVSDAVEDVRRVVKPLAWDQAIGPLVSRFIIAKPDPLVEVLAECDGVTTPGPGYRDDARVLRAALAARGLKIVEVGHD